MSRVILSRQSLKRAEVIVDAVFARLRGLNFQIDPAAGSNRRMREACIEEVALLIEDGAVRS